MTATRIADAQDVLAIALDPLATMRYAEFPHPLITVDYDANGRVVQIVGAGRMTQDVLATYTHWRRYGAHDTGLLVQMLGALR